MKQQLNGRIEASMRRLCGVLFAGVAGLVSVSCLIDTDNPCSDGQIEATDGSKLCLCPDGQAATPSGCVECVENETPGADGCDCLPGYERVAPDAQCTPLAPPPEEMMMTEGDAGLSGDMMLTSMDDPAMASTLSGEGLGTPCSSDADCTGPDATFCDLMFSMTCIIVGCDAVANNCPNSLLCCDYSMPDAPFTLCGEMCF